MASLFQRGNNTSPLSPRAQLEAKYNSSRLNLLLVVLFTVINVALLLTAQGTYFLFSASIPYYLVMMGMFLCGKLPAEFYDPAYEYTFMDSSIYVMMTVIAVLIVLLYVVCFLLSGKQRTGWLIVATVLFAIDTVGMLLIYGINLQMLMDLLFHAWVMYYLIVGVIAGRKLKKLPTENAEPIEATAEPTAESDASNTKDEE